MVSPCGTLTQRPARREGNRHASPSTSSAARVPVSRTRRIRLALPGLEGGHADMIVSGMTGNEIFCLAEKGLLPGELCVGNSVCAMGIGGTIGSFGQAIAG